MEFWAILLVIYLIIRDIIWTYKEIQLIDRALPREYNDKKVELWQRFMNLWKLGSKRQVKEVPETKTEPIVDSGQKELIAGPETAEHRQGVDPF
jgi:hypothetical protein